MSDTPGPILDGAAVAVTESAGRASTVTVTVRYFAAARAAAGRNEERLVLPEPATVSDVIVAAQQRHGESLSRVLQRCSYLHNGTAVHDRAAFVADDDQVDVLPPFAGG
jgi:molybdopterin converting factor small subunit